MSGVLKIICMMYMHVAVYKLVALELHIVVYFIPIYSG